MIQFHSPFISKFLFPVLVLGLLLAFIAPAEANRKKKKLPDNPPNGTSRMAHLERERETARENDEALGFIFGKNPNSAPEPKIGGTSKGKKGKKGVTKDPDIEATEGIVRDLSRGARLIYLEKGNTGRLNGFVQEKLKEAAKGKAYGVIFDAEMTAYFGTVTDGDWRKAEKRREKAGDVIFERFNNKRPLDVSPLFDREAFEGIEPAKPQVFFLTNKKDQTFQGLVENIDGDRANGIRSKDNQRFSVPLHELSAETQQQLRDHFEQQNVTR